MAVSTSFSVATAHPLIDDLLDKHRTTIGEQFVGYRNHCFTVYNIVRALMDLTPEDDAAVAIAVAFHDIALWTDDRIDYIDPSIALARDWCAASGHGEKADRVADMIFWHHKIFRGALKTSDPLVLAFRNADWSAFTFGFIPFDRNKDYRRAIASEFPDAGFHDFLNRRALRHVLSGGIFNPLPMMKW
ncbi:MAG: HD domain-containing protein [Pseudomonadota bacterium]